MFRYTRRKDNFECRHGLEGCKAEYWIEKLTGTLDFDTNDMCDSCPFMRFINRLAELEDLAEDEYDDLK